MTGTICRRAAEAGILSSTQWFRLRHVSVVVRAWQASSVEIKYCKYYTDGHDREHHARPSHGCVNNKSAARGNCPECGLIGTSLAKPDPSANLSRPQKWSGSSTGTRNVDSLDQTFPCLASQMQTHLRKWVGLARLTRDNILRVYVIYYP